jgi:hypothetical protein
MLPLGSLRSHSQRNITNHIPLMSNDNKFTESQLKQLGFHLKPSGEWSKDGVQVNNPKPHATEHKPDEQEDRHRKIKAEENGKVSFRYRLIIHSYRTRLIDPSNASMKTIEDCLSDPSKAKNYGIGIFPDDSAKYCDQPLFLQTKVKKGEEKTEIEVLRYEVSR